MTPPAATEAKKRTFLATTLPGLEPIAAEEIRDRLRTASDVVRPGVLRFASAAGRRRLSGLRCILSLDGITAEIPGNYLRPKALAALGQKLKRLRMEPSRFALRGARDAPPSFRVVATVPDGAAVRFFDVQRIAAYSFAEALGWRATGAVSCDYVVVLHASRECVVVAFRVACPQERMSDAASAEEHLLAAALVRLARLSPGQLCVDACFTGGVPVPPPTAPGGRLRVVAGGPHPRPLAPRAQHGWAAVWRPHALPLRSSQMDRVFCFLPAMKLQPEPTAAELARVLRDGGRAVMAVPRELGMRRAIEAEPLLDVERFLRVRVLGRRVHLLVARRLTGEGRLLPPAPPTTTPEH